MSDSKFQSALASSKPIVGTVQISDVTDQGMIDLRGSATDKKFCAAIKKVLNVSLPQSPRRSTTNAEITILWLSIDQWLILCPHDAAQKTVTELKKALGTIHSLVVDVSDARSIIRLEGNGARTLLMKASPVDLTQPEYTPGTVRRLRFAELAAMVYFRPETQESEAIDLFVFRSYGNYAWDWLAQTANPAAEIRLFGTQPIAEI